MEMNETLENGSGDMLIKLKSEIEGKYFNKAAATRAIFSYDFLLLKDVKEYIT